MTFRREEEIMSEVQRIHDPEFLFLSERAKHHDWYVQVKCTFNTFMFHFQLIKFYL